MRLRHTERAGSLGIAQEFSVLCARRSWLGVSFVIIVATVASLGASRLAHAATRTWSASSSAHGWNTASNWSGNAVPGMTDDVVIDGSVSNSRLDIDANADVASITIQGAYTRDIAPTGSQTIRVRGNVTLNSSSAGSGLTISTGSTQIDGSLSLVLGTFKGNGGTLVILGSVSQTGGTFTADTGTTQVDANFTEAGGTFTGSTGRVQVGGNLSVTSGTFNGNSGIIQIAGNLGPLSGGTFRASSTTTKIGGSFNRTSASNTFDANDGALLFNATSSKSHTFTGAALGKVTFNDGLVGYWNLDEAANPFTDKAGYANNATLTGTYAAASTRPPVAFADAAAMAFNGSTNYMTIGTTSLPAANAAQTISAWVNFAGAASTQSIVAMTASGSAIKLGLGGGNLRVLRNDGTALAQVAAPSTGAWHHVAYTWDGTTNRLYVDGVVTTSATAHDSATPTAAFIGATSAGADRLSGSLDEIRIYNRALGTREITDMAFGRMPATGTVTHTLSDTLATSAGSNDGHFVIASGIVAGASAINVEGDWLNYGGRFTGTGLLTLNGGAASRVVLSGGESFPNLTVDTSGKYTLSDRLWVPGTLNISAGADTFNDGSYVFHAGALVTNAAGGYQETTGTVVLDGRSSQTITAQHFNGLRIEAPNEAGLAGYWKLDEGQGTTTRDVSGSGNAGTLSSSGATWTGASSTISFDNPVAMSFDGASGYVSAGVTGLPAANAAQSVSVWVKFSSAASTQTLAALTASGSAIKLGLGGGNVRALRSDGTVLAQVTAPSAGAWHHVAYVYDPTLSGVNRDKIYIDGTAATGTNTSHDTSAPTAAFIGASSASADFLSGQIDDVRVYTQALTSAHVGSLVAGRYAGTGITTTVTLGHNVTVASSGIGIFIDSGVLYTSNRTVTVSVTGTPVLVNSGTLHVGSAVVNFDGGLTVAPMGTLLMDESGGEIQPGVDSIVAINGTLTASHTGARITRDGGGQRFTFRVGTTANATPTLNITGLTVRDTDIDGMRINHHTSAVTTFARFDNILFSRGVAGAGAQFLKIYGASLQVTSNGCSFGAGQGAGALPAWAVTLTGNGTADGETRAVFGSAICAGSKTDSATDLCETNWKSDDDSDENGVGNTPASNGAVIQFLRGAATDTAGTIEGFPTAAFDWNTFTYYSTYVAFHDVSGTVDRIYVRDTTGAAKYSWDSPSGETIVGTPRWNTVSGAHYLYVAMASGKVYRLVDNLASLILDPGWTTNPYACSCAIVTPLGMDTNNLFWGGTQSGAQKLWTLGQTSQTQPMGSPFTVTATITSAAPALWANAGTSYLFLAITGHLLEINVSNQTLVADNTNPGSASVYGRIGIGTTGGNRVFAGDDGGNFWAIDPANFAGTNKVWSYAIGGDSIRSSPYYDYAGNKIAFGTEAGKVVVLGSNGAAVTGYPYTPGSASDAIRSALLYAGGILVVGTTTGKLFFIDRNNGTTGPALIRQYSFGPTEAVSGIGYDASSSRYMVSTSDSTTKNGRLYYIDLISDPTSGSS